MKMAAASLILLGGVALSPITHAYGGSGGGGGGSSCQEPSFTDISPENATTVSVLDRFSLVASDNTDMQTLEIKVNGQLVKPELTPQRSGATRAEVKVEPALNTPGKARITLRAKSRDGCKPSSQSTSRSSPDRHRVFSLRPRTRSRHGTPSRASKVHEAWVSADSDARPCDASMTSPSNSGHFILRNNKDMPEADACGAR